MKLYEDNLEPKKWAENEIVFFKVKQLGLKKYFINESI